MVYSAVGVTKRYGDNTVLDNVNFTIAEGRIHGLIGENGAGKSTLLKIMSGLVQPDGGELSLDGSKIRYSGVDAATAQGVYLVPQEPSLLPYLSIAENMALGRRKANGKRGAIVNWRAMENQARESLARLGFTIDVRLLAGGLSIAAQQLVECARALSFDCRYILFDEPTSPLDSAEVDMLADRLFELKDQGRGIVLISHRLPEMFQFTDCMTVLRDGKVVTEECQRPYEHKVVVQAMIGRELADTSKLNTRRQVSSDDTVALQVVSLAAPPEVRDVSFELRPKEVVGLAGLIGSGRTETAECIVGLRKRSSGTVWHHQRKLPASPADAFRSGVVYMSEDRAKNGSFLDLSVNQNITAGIIDRIAGVSRAFAMSRRKERDAAALGTKRTDVRAPSGSAALRSLSGGNQQKSLIARALLMNPDVLVLDEPTRGVDVGAKQSIHETVQQLADDGLAVLVISSELEELTGLCDRIVVLYEGKSVCSVPRNQDGSWPEEKLGQYIVGHIQ